jgi:hypothetical protein
VSAIEPSTRAVKLAISLTPGGCCNATVSPGELFNLRVNLTQAAAAHTVTISVLIFLVLATSCQQLPESRLDCRAFFSGVFLRVASAGSKGVLLR